MSAKAKQKTDRQQERPAAKPEVKVLSGKEILYCYSPSQIIEMLGLEISTKDLLEAELEGSIPSRIFVKKGKTIQKLFHISAIPSIAKFYEVAKAPKMCQVIAIFVDKGGDGKTTTTKDLGRLLALMGLRVLSIGSDHQGNFSRYFGASIEDNPVSLIDVIGKKDLPIEDAISQSEFLGNHYFIAENRDLNNIDDELSTLNRQEYRLDEKLSDIKQFFDVILIDCPPTRTKLVANALVAADFVFGPVAPKHESKHGFDGGVRSHETFETKMGRKPKLKKYYLNMVDLTKSSETIVYDEIKNEHSDILFKNEVKRAATFEDASSVAMSVFEFAPTSRAAKELRNVYKELWSEVLMHQDNPTTVIRQKRKISNKFQAAEAHAN